MDFHSLTRKELQTLCKKNKIPANITNVAMADALKALETVEGLDEIINQSQSPEKTMNKSSQEIPSTVTRTSTRRKATKEEAQSTQPTTRSRTMTRKSVESEEENKNLHAPDTPVMATTTARRRAQKTEPQVEEQKKSDLVETPVLQSGRRRAAVGSTRKKVEAQKAEGSVQHGYGTRRSVRLLEKCIAGLSLKEGGRMEPVKIDEMVEGEVEEKNGQSEVTSEVPLARNLIVSLEDESDLKDGENDCVVTSDAGAERYDNIDSLSSALDTKDASPKKETHWSDAYLTKSETKQADIPEGTMDSKGSDDVAALSEDFIEIDCSKVEEELGFENNGGSYANETKVIEALVAEASEDKPEQVLDHASSAKVMDPKEVVSGEEDANHAVQETECQKSVGTECDINVVMQGYHASDDLAKQAEAEQCDEGNASQKVSDLLKGFIISSKEEAEDASNIVDASGDADIDGDSSSDNSSLADEGNVSQNVSDLHKGSIDSSKEEAEDAPNIVDASGDADTDDDSSSDNSSLADEGNVSQNVSDLHKGSIDSSKEEAEDASNIVDASGDGDTDDDSSSDNSSLADEDDVSQNVSDLYKGSIDSSKEEAEDVLNIIDASGDTEIDDDSSSDNGSLGDEEEEEVPCETDSYGSEDPVTGIMNKDALIDVKVAEAETPLVETRSQNATRSVVVKKILDYGDAEEEALVDICIKPEKEFPEITLEIPAKLMSPLPSASLVSNSEIAGSKPLSPALTAQFSQPTRFTPRSSSKKQATVPKLAHVSDNNKENIDNNSEKEVEPGLAKMKKNKSVLDEETMQNLDVYSLRQLKKLTKKFDKLQIAENMKNIEENYDSKKHEKTRAALRILPQNCMHAGKTEKEN